MFYKRLALIYLPLTGDTIQLNGPLAMMSFVLCLASICAFVEAVLLCTVLSRGHWTCL